MANLRITRLGHGGVLYRSPEDAWVWVDRWTGAPTYADAYRTAEKVSVVAPTHCHFDHVGDDCVDLVELAQAEGAATIGSHEMSVWLGARGIDAIGMNKGGTVEAAGHPLHDGPRRSQRRRDADDRAGAGDARPRMLGLGDRVRGRDDGLPLRRHRPLR